MISFFKTLGSFFKDKHYRNLTLATILVLLIGTVIYHYVEGWKWLDALYFSVITLTTVGYGDFSPQTDIGKLFTIFYVLTGVGIIFGFINTFYQHRIAKYKEIAEKRTKEKRKNIKIN